MHRGVYPRTEEIRHKKSDESKKVNHYKQYGFTCLVIWESELLDEQKIINKTKEVL